MWYDGMIIDISTNYEEHLKSGKSIEYDVKDKGFQNLMQCVCLGSKAFFSYNPTDTEIINYIAKKQNRKAEGMEISDCSTQDVEDARAALLEAEAQQPMQEKRANGDASEIGLIKFCQPILPLSETRGQYPTF